uniref:Uncharacterized protein n=1 Tax=Globodera rostochiensis TaxID=31243 RepID=A0A914HL91_GLORO
MFCPTVLFSCILFGVLSSVKGLRCNKEFAVEAGANFSKNSMESVCSGPDTVCSFVQCTDSSGKAIPSIENIGCEDPKRVNCTKLGDECNIKGGKICCQTCATDLCNVEKICEGEPTNKGGGGGGGTAPSGGVSVRAGVVALVVPLMLHVCWMHVAKSI